MQIGMEPIKLVTIITERSKGKKLIDLLNDNGFSFHDAFLGRGTAKTGLTAYLGIGEEEKTIVILYLKSARVSELFDILEREEYFEDYGGLAYTVPITSVSNIDVLKLINT